MVSFNYIRQLVWIQSWIQTLKCKCFSAGQGMIWPISIFSEERGGIYRKWSGCDKTWSLLVRLPTTATTVTMLQCLCLIRAIQVAQPELFWSRIALKKYVNTVVYCGTLHGSAWSAPIAWSGQLTGVKGCQEMRLSYFGGTFHFLTSLVLTCSNPDRREINPAGWRIKLWICNQIKLNSRKKKLPH